MKSCRVENVLEMVNMIAPFELAEPWDNVGLLFGGMGRPVSKVLVALDMTEGVLDEAERIGAELIVTHHPMMFSARKHITEEDREGRLLLRMGAMGVSHIAAHTNLDAAPEGVNETLMRKMGCTALSGEGCIRAGDLPESMTFEALCRKTESVLHTVVRAYGDPDRGVKRLACCSGAGGSEVGEAAALGADCFLTGEIKHHEALEAVSGGLCVMEAGHFETENPVCKVLSASLQNAADTLQYNLIVFCSEAEPFGRNV